MSTPPQDLPADVVWNDRAFDYDPALVTDTRESLFALDDAMRSALLRESLAGRVQAARTAALLTLVFGPDLKAFAYAGGHSTPAAETWRNRRGDCLSLTIMSVALARALDVPAVVQEVRVPPLIDRRGGVDFANRHVNLLVRNPHELRALGRSLPAGDIVVDFEPQPGSRQRGAALSDSAVLARYLNNRGAEHLAAGDRSRAYAHLKAAIAADPAFGPAYGNLAQLYLRSGLQAQAEGLLRAALARDDGDADFALVALYELLLSQGRDAEAHAFATALERRRERDPYYWLALGLQRLQAEQWHAATAALERAQALSSGFAEVHQALAIAYWRDGRLLQARDQLALLGSIGGAEGKLALLQRKLGGSSAGETRGAADAGRSPLSKTFRHQ